MICQSCGAETGGLLDDTVKRLCGCKNCMVDIGTRGGWVDVGYQILRDLVKRYGKETVLAELKKHIKI